MSERIVALDVQYDGDSAAAATVVFEGWAADAALDSWVTPVTSVAEYEPGSFYKRELPSLLSALDPIAEQLANMTAVIIDGYVWLDPHGRPGLGAHLFEALSGRVPVVGVAKNPFGDEPFAIPVLRGQSERPLYVTTAGMPVEDAAHRVRDMHGPFRVPTMLRLVDMLARSG